MLSAMDYVLHMNGRAYDDVVLTAMSHDIGKFDTKDFKNSKGEPTEDAHYYQHHFLGSYKSLFFKYPSYANQMYVSLLIELHMKPHLEWKQSEKAKQKDINLFGEDVYKDIMMIHMADINAK